MTWEEFAALVERLAGERGLKNARCHMPGVGRAVLYFGDYDTRRTAAIELGDGLTEDAARSLVDKAAVL